MLDPPIRMREGKELHDQLHLHGGVGRRLAAPRHPGRHVRTARLDGAALHHAEVSQSVQRECDNMIIAGRVRSGQADKTIPQDRGFKQRLREANNVRLVKVLSEK